MCAAPEPEGCPVLPPEEPGGFATLGARNFWRELDEMTAVLKASWFAGLGNWVERAFGRHAAQTCVRCTPPFVERLTLDVDQVVAREERRPAVESTPFVKAIFFVLCWTLDRLYEGRPIPKFWVLEVVARMPYFSYVSVLHLYESLGWWRTPQLRELHNAEEDNELHHMLIMESLGGNSAWADRFMAQHAAILYYWIVAALFAFDPVQAYNFMVLVEEHAHVTYAQFAEENEHLLRQIPPPPVAEVYYSSGDLYYFDKFQTRRPDVLALRRPPCDNMHDVFVNIRDDELEHVLTMRRCEDWWAGRGPAPMPTAEASALGTREAWERWSEEVGGLELEDHDIKREDERRLRRGARP